MRKTRLRRLWFLSVIASGIILYQQLLVGYMGSSISSGTAVADEQSPFLVVLGTAQDAGIPQAGCQKSCCRAVWENSELRRLVSCLAIVDPETSQRWIIDATPDFKEQLHLLDQIFASSDSPGITGIFLTHAHMGHYTGLMQLGRETMGAKQIPVYAMRRLHNFLKSNGPWDQLVRLQNISLIRLQADTEIRLNERISITPFLVPHRDEYSETVGYLIRGPHRSAAFIPDIDKWEKWQRPVEKLISQVDVAFLDGTFYSGEELPGRDMSEIPHPFIVESIQRFGNLPAPEKSKIRFIHLNHTNPALIPGSEAQHQIKQAGFAVAVEKEKFRL